MTGIYAYIGIDIRGKYGKSAAFAVQIPRFARTQMVHKGVIIVFWNNSYL